MRIFSSQSIAGIICIMIGITTFIFKNSSYINIYEHWINSIIGIGFIGMAIYHGQQLLLLKRILPVQKKNAARHLILIVCSVYVGFYTLFFKSNISFSPLELILYSYGLLLIGTVLIYNSLQKIKE